MKNVIVAGNMDIDHLMGMNDLFSENILSSNLNNLSVSFQPSSHESAFGGAGANIAYNLKLFGLNPYLFTVLGKDFKKFFRRFDELGISTQYIDLDKNAMSPACFILNDGEKNQITIFSSASTLNHKLGMDLKDLESQNIDLMIISSNTAERMRTLARDATKRGIKYIFDPGQSITSIPNDVLAELTFNSVGVILNSYEFDLLLKKTKFGTDEILENVDFIVKTKGIEGSDIYQKNSEIISVPAILAVTKDPTGCGDAFRAGFIYAYLEGRDLKYCCELGTVAASFVLEYVGTQNHNFSASEVEERLTEHFIK